MRALGAELGIPIEVLDVISPCNAFLIYSLIFLKGDFVNSLWLVFAGIWSWGNNDGNMQTSNRVHHRCCLNLMGLIVLFEFMFHCYVIFFELITNKNVVTKNCICVCVCMFSSLYSGFMAGKWKVILCKFQMWLTRILNIMHFALSGTRTLKKETNLKYT